MAHIVTEDEKKRMKRNGYGEYYRPPDFDPVPSNQFVLEIKPNIYISSSMQRRWSDSETKSLDSQVGKFIIGLLKFCPIIKQKRLESEAEERIRIEKQEHQKQEEDKIEKERHRLKLLEFHIKMLIKSEWISIYIERLKDSLKTVELNPEKKSRFEQWLEWVIGYKKTIDPFNPENLLFDINFPEKEVEKSGPSQQNYDSSYSGPWKPKEERNFGWWDRPPWKW